MTGRKKLSDVMNPRKFVVLPDDATAAAAAKKMLERQVGAVVVMNGAVLAGIVTERDFNFRLVAAGRDPNTTTLAEIMTPNPKTFGPDTPVMEALETMQKRAYRHVPIEHEGKVIGIVSLRDIFLEVKRALERDIVDSEQFIVGSDSGTTH
jgi:CBS domain-containing protein